ncbi:MAG TPA: hypothetical protein VMR86_15595 [Myxococcota bacterium]|nr:hypothetical protein [Myxococcota bacterium]
MTRRSLTLAALSLLCACASPEPPLRLHEAARLEPGTSVGFFTLGLDATRDPDFQPIVKGIYVSETRGSEKKIQALGVEAPYDSTNLRNDSLVSFALPPGDYEIEKFVATHVAFMNNQVFAIPLHVEIHLEPGEVRYFGHFEVDLGHCFAVPNDAGRGEPKADQVIERLDRASVFVSIGHVGCATEIQDRYAADLWLVNGRFGLPESVKVADGTVPHMTRPP